MQIYVIEKGDQTLFPIFKFVKMIMVMKKQKQNEYLL